MMDDKMLDRWTEWSRRDDWHQLFVGSDIRQMLGEIARLRTAARLRDDGAGDFRCHNCKRIVHAIVAPERCSDCQCSAFSACAPASGRLRDDGGMREALSAVEAFVERWDSGARADTDYVASLMKAALAASKEG